MFVFVNFNKPERRLRAPPFIIIIVFRSPARISWKQEEGSDPRIFGTKFGEREGPYASKDVVKLLEIGMQTNPLS